MDCPDRLVFKLMAVLHIKKNKIKINGCIAHILSLSGGTDPFNTSSPARAQDEDLFVFIISYHGRYSYMGGRNHRCS